MITMIFLNQLKRKILNSSERHAKTETLILAALFLAVGVVLPSLTGSIKEIGDSLLPMHLIVMLCGAICGWKYATCVGFVLPFFRSMLFSMPPLYPNAVWMALELATYGFVIGFLYSLRKEYKRWSLFLLAGRIVWGVSKAIFLGVAGKPFGFEAFIVGGFLDAIPGILLQLILVPVIVEIVERVRGKKNIEE